MKRRGVTVGVDEANTGRSDLHDDGIIRCFKTLALKCSAVFEEESFVFA